MKKIIIPILLLIMFIPFVVNAEGESCEAVSTNNEKTIQKKVKQEIINKDKLSDKTLKKAIFNYKILDLDNNILAETTNDSDGNVVFDCFTVKSSDIGDYKLYKIIMEDNKNIPFDYDPNIIYFSLRVNYTNGKFDPIIAFYKDDGNVSPERYNTSYKGEVFHATEEELQGQAYAVLDKDTGVLTFFRDEPNKYTNNQEEGNKIYYTGFEEKDRFSDWCYNVYIKEIVFKDAIKPKGIKNWFYYLQNLEKVDISKLDTSLVTSLEFFFTDCPKLKELDISTLDTTNVTSMWKMLYNLDIEYIDLTVWNLNQNLARMQMSESIGTIPSLKYLNISNLGNWTSSAEISYLPCLEYLEINDVYNFGNTNGPGVNPNMNNGYYYSPQKNKKYTAGEIRNNLVNHYENMEGYYIRPMCTTNSSFLIKYNSSKVKNSIMNISTNPETGGKVLVYVSMILLSIVVFASTVLIIKKKID